MSNTEHCDKVFSSAPDRYESLLFDQHYLVASNFGPPIVDSAEHDLEPPFPVHYIAMNLHFFSLHVELCFPVDVRHKAGG